MHQNKHSYFFLRGKNCTFAHTNLPIEYVVKTFKKLYSWQKKQRKSRRSKKVDKDIKPMLFDKINYIYMSAGIAMVFIGFFGMWLESKGDGFFSLFISPLLVIGGFVVVAIGVLKSDEKVAEANPKTNTPQEQS